MKQFILAATISAAAVGFGQGGGNFAAQQAYAEMSRVSGQVDVIQNNLDDIQRRVGRLEAKRASDTVQTEIAALKSSIAELRREMQSMRGEIVRELSAKISKLTAAPPPPPKPVERTVVIGPHFEYTVKPGDTLSLIAEAFGTSVRKIREMNSLRNDSLRVGQKVKIPKK